MGPMTELLKKLCTLQGAPGHEDEVRAFILSRISEHAACRVDALGNIIAEKRGENRPKTRLMLDAHMDEVGFIITGAGEDGTLRFAPAGGINPGVVFGRRVLIGDIPGVIGGKAVHTLGEEERKKPVPFEEMRIDIGASSEEEALGLVKIGSAAVFDSQFNLFGEELIKARALDDRAGCAVLIELIRSPLEYDMTFTFTVQEELGTRGAKTAAFSVNPDAAIVVEATTAADIPDVPEDEKVCFVGKGPVLSFMDGGTVYDRELYRLAEETAAEISVPCQPKKAVAGGNNAGSIHVSGAGVRTLAVSLPCRYLHSGSSVIKASDLMHTAALVRAVAQRIAGTAL